MVHTHKQPAHNYERIVDAEEKQTEELRNLIAESKGKITFCQEASSSLESSLSDLQLQHDNTKGLIEESFQTFKAMLDKKRVCDVHVDFRIKSKCVFMLVVFLEPFRSQYCIACFNIKHLLAASICSGYCIIHMIQLIFCNELNWNHSVNQFCIHA